MAVEKEINLSDVDPKDLTREGVTPEQVYAAALKLAVEGNVVKVGNVNASVGTRDVRVTHITNR